MANAVNDNMLAANLEYGSMRRLRVQAVQQLTELHWKVAALPGELMPFRIFRQGFDCAFETLQPEERLVGAPIL
jgi:hypothetical protein